MKISVLTLFPEMFSALNYSILGRAQENNVIEINVVDIRAFSKDKHRKCDDYPFGGGAGMVMTPQPIYDAIMSIDSRHEANRIYLSPKGKVLNQKIVMNYASASKDLVLLCGHYEGIDQRIIELCIDEEISIGDYILTGGELPAMVLIDSICRFVPSVLGHEESAYNESFFNGLLEYPHYTRPQEFMGIKVPDVLLNGHHENINAWRKEQAVKITKTNRPELLEN